MLPIEEPINPQFMQITATPIGEILDRNVREGRSESATNSWILAKASGMHATNQDRDLRYYVIEIPVIPEP